MKIRNLFCVFLALIVFPAAYSKDKQIYRLLPDGTVILRGIARVKTFDFADATSSFCQAGPVGIKGVALGDYLYVYNERSQMLRRDASKHDSGVLILRGSGLFSNTNEACGGWPAWYGHLSNVIGAVWQAQIPGQSQVLLEVRRDGSIKIAQKFFFLPAKDKNGKFATNNVIANVESKFITEVESALSQINKKDLAFPAGSSATSAVIVTTLVADHDLFVTGANLSTMHTASYNADQLELLRLTTILESGYLYEQASMIRRLIPSSTTQNLIPRSAPRRFVSMGNDFYYLDLGHMQPPPLGGQRSQMISSLMNVYLKQLNYDAAEKFARSLVANRDDLKAIDAELIRQLKNQGRNKEIEDFVPKDLLPGKSGATDPDVS
jgi:hypothetical protein